jgi:hypothetical protein
MIPSHSPNKQKRKQSSNRQKKKMWIIETLDIPTLIQPMSSPCNTRFQIAQCGYGAWAIFAH